MHIQEEKVALRSAIDERLKRVNEAERSAESRSLCRRLTESIPEGTPICAFYPMRSEPDITPFLQEVLRRKDSLYLPCFAEAVVFRRALDLSSLVRGKLGTLEPPQDAPLMEVTLTQLTILVPGRAFDIKGNRLGRGNGGYDRWLGLFASHPWKIIGVAMECQIVDSVPMESHDRRMDAIATARGITERKEN